MKITHFKQTEVNLEVEDISLLTADEADELPAEIARYDAWWWTKTPGLYKDNVATVHSLGSVNRVGDRVWVNERAVRPVLTIRNLESLDFKVGEKLIIQGKEYRYIGGNKALYSDKAVCHIFDKEANDYEKSKLKKFVDKWLKKERSKQ